jgi:hypothetical protein
MTASWKHALSIENASSMQITSLLHMKTLLAKFSNCFIFLLSWTTLFWAYEHLCRNQFRSASMICSFLIWTVIYVEIRLPHMLILDTWAYMQKSLQEASMVCSCNPKSLSFTFSFFLANHHKLLSHDLTIIIVCNLLFHGFAFFKHKWCASRRCMKHM